MASRASQDGATATATENATVKPSLPFIIKGTMLNGDPFEFPCSRGTVLKAAKEYMKQGFQGVTIWQWEQDGWVESSELTQQARNGVAGNGNQRGIMALQLLQEHTNVLVKLTAKSQKTDALKEGYEQEVRAWIAQFSNTCQALHMSHMLGEILQGTLAETAV